MGGGGGHQPHGPTSTDAPAHVMQRTTGDRPRPRKESDAGRPPQHEHKAAVLLSFIIYLLLFAYLAFFRDLYPYFIRLVLPCFFWTLFFFLCLCCHLFSLFFIIFYLSMCMSYYILFCLSALLLLLIVFFVFLGPPPWLFIFVFCPALYHIFVFVPCVVFLSALFFVFFSRVCFDLSILLSVFLSVLLSFPLSTSSLKDIFVVCLFFYHLQCPLMPQTKPHALVLGPSRR